MLKNFIPKTIRSKIMVVTAMITFVITVLTVTICFSVFQSFLKKNQIQSTEFSLQVVSNNIAADMKDIIYFSKWCCSNNDVLDYLEAFYDREKLPVAAKDNDKLRPLALSTYNRLKEEYYNTRASEYVARTIISTNNQNNFLQIITTANNSSSYAATIIRNSSFFQQLHDNPGYLWIGLIDDPFARINPAPIIPIVRPIYNQFNSEIIGWTYIELSTQLFTDYLASYPLSTDSSLFLTIEDKTYGIGENGWQQVTMPYVDSKDVTGKTTLGDLTHVMSITMEDGSKQTLVQCPVDGMDGWYLSQILSKQQLIQQRNIYSALLLGICAIILSLGILLTYFLNKIIGSPIGQLRRKIDSIAEGDFSKDPSIEWEHELGRIGQGINNMSGNILTLMNKRVADEKQKKDLEYQILQSQINPHFLYNTLNSIKWMATIQNATGIADMTTALARLLKNVSKGTSSIIPLREELDLVKDYFLIQQYRYGGSITMEYDIKSPDLYDCAIHRFTLQPIIENALFHGIEPKGTTGRISLVAESLPSSSGQDLKISITDNGIGMTPTMIDQLLHEDPAVTNKADFFKQVGIRNVNQRIQYEYGTTYGISITSEIGVYTTMTILCPLSKII